MVDTYLHGLDSIVSFFDSLNVDPFDAMREDELVDDLDVISIGPN